VPSAVPLALIDAPQQGTGKSLIAEVVGLLAQGYDATDSAPARDDAEEWRKRLTSALLAGNAVINFDNVEGVLSNPVLAAALTTPEFRDRLLGGNTMVSIPVRVTWIATGNNIRIGGDMNRRCYRIRLDAHTARPWERASFAIEDLPSHVKAHRGELLAALLTAARAWYVAGQPAPAGLPRMGNYWPWVRIVGGILAFAGVEGFLSSQDELYEEADEEAGGWRPFFSAWRAWCPDPVTTKTVAAAVTGAAQRSPRSDEDRLSAALAAAVPEAVMNGDGSLNERRFGGQIGRIAGRRWDTDGLRVECVGKDSHTKNNLYQVLIDEEPKSNTATQLGSQSGSAVSAVLPSYHAEEPERGVNGTSPTCSGLTQTPQTPRRVSDPALQADSACGVCSPTTAVSGVEEPESIERPIRRRVINGECVAATP
jgi:hypothetical protein